MSTIILGITGSIAAYKAADIASALVKKGHSVHCICTEKALEFVTPLTLQTLSRNKVYSSFDDDGENWMPIHIDLAQQADLVVIAPATANTIAEMTHGLASSILTSLYLAAQSPVLICPAMNSAMWSNPVTQENVRTLSGRKNHHVLGPASSGLLACGTEGAGKLVPVDDIIVKIEELLGRQDSV